MATSLLACASKERAQAEPHQTSEPAPGGARLSVAHASLEQGLAGSFAKGELSIRFSCVRGERARDSLAGDVNAAPYLMTLTITNAQGDLLVSSGQAPADTAASPRTPPESREAELGLVVELGNAIQRAELPPNMEPERRAIVQAAQATAAPKRPPGAGYEPAVAR
jgi:hypothetical protein